MSGLDLVTIHKLIPVTIYVSMLNVLLLLFIYIFLRILTQEFLKTIFYE